MFTSLLYTLLGGIMARCLLLLYIKVITTQVALLREGFT